MEKNPRKADLNAVLRSLDEGGVEAIVVGGVAAVLHGAPVHTVDVDIVHRREPANVERLIAVVRAIGGYVREPQPRHLVPSSEILAGRGQILLSTRLGPLDLLCVLHDGRGYDELLGTSSPLAGYAHLRLLDLETLIAVKVAAGRAKDRLMVPLLVRQRARPSDD